MVLKANWIHFPGPFETSAANGHHTMVGMSKSNRSNTWNLSIRTHTILNLNNVFQVILPKGLLQSTYTRSVLPHKSTLFSYRGVDSLAAGRAQATASATSLS